MPSTPADVLAFCRERLANYKVPRQVVFRAGLPATRPARCSSGCSRGGEPDDDRGPSASRGPEAGEPVRYEERGPLAVVTLNRPRYRNAQNSAMTYALDAAFARAVNDDEVAVIVLAGAGKHFCAGHDIGSPGRDADESFDRQAVLWWDHVGKAGRRRPVRPRDGGLPGHVPALAGDPQAGHRDGAGRVHRWRPDARLGVRPDRRRGRRLLRRPGGADGDSGRGVLRPSVGARAPFAKEVLFTGRALRRRARLPGGHGEPGGAARRTGRGDLRAGRPDRRDAAVRPGAGQAGGQPVRGPDGPAAGHGVGVRPAPPRARAQR